MIEYADAVIAALDTLTREDIVALDLGEFSAAQVALLHARYDAAPDGDAGPAAGECCPCGCGRTDGTCGTEAWLDSLGGRDEDLFACTRCGATGVHENMMECWPCYHGVHPTLDL